MPTGKPIGTQLELWPVRPGGTRRWHGNCSTQYVRGREAGEAGVRSLAVIANCNQSVILQLEV